MGLSTHARLFILLVCSSTVIYLLLGYLPSQDFLGPARLAVGDSRFDAKSRRLLNDLGLQSQPKLYPQSYHDTQDLPVLVMTLESDQLPEFRNFIKSKLKHLRIKRLVVYDLGLTEKEQEQVRNHCLCLLRQVPWLRYPQHVKAQLSAKLYRPLLIQESLQEFGVVFWCHASMEFISEDIYWPLVAAHEHGLVAWSSTSLPTSALTYHSVFKSFNTSAEKYHFHHIVEPEPALYVNTDRVYSGLMRPWVHCTLQPQCSLPLGAQSGGCRLRKPSYLYTGCHRYDTSIFNVILGSMFDFQMPYRGHGGLFTVGGKDPGNATVIL